MKKTILITGASDGIGLHTALELARKGHHIIAHGRSEKKLHAAIETIKTEVPTAHIDTVIFDLAKMASVHAGAKEIIERFPLIHVLLNNAGTYQHGKIVTLDRFEMTFAVNHLNHFLLTHLLYKTLEKSALPNDPARIVNVSSIAHTKGKINLNDPFFDQESNPYDGYTAYAQSKLANIYFSQELAKKADPTKVITHSLHPGVIDTKLLRSGFSIQGAPLEVGTRTSIFVALDETVGKSSGFYYSDSALKATAPTAHNEIIQKQLWDLSCTYCKISTFGES